MLRLRSFLHNIADGMLASNRVIFVPDGIRIRTKTGGGLGQLLFARYPKLFMKAIPLSLLLMGGENGSTGASFARLTEDPLRTSTPMTRSPHFHFLSEYRVLGDTIFEPMRFSKTAYWKNACTCIKLQGHYFRQNTIEGVIAHVKEACRRLDEQEQNHIDLRKHFPAIVRRISYSDCYEVLDGHHRLAIATIRGRKEYPCVIAPDEPSVTVIQQMVMDSSWTEGQRVLYQPVDFPELKSWTVVRKCADRFQMMMNFLSAENCSSGSYLDVGCSYGWFVNSLLGEGFDTFGVDRDSSAVTIGRMAYGLDESRTKCADVVQFLTETNDRYEVVSCFSVLHHFILGRALGNNPVPAERFVHLLDTITKRVLFIDTGESHEKWFAQALSGWDIERIIGWIKANTSFTKIAVLGRDEDGVGPYRGQYGRHLIACYRA